MTFSSSHLPPPGNPPSSSRTRILAIFPPCRPRHVNIVLGRALLARRLRSCFTPHADARITFPRNICRSFCHSLHCLFLLTILESQALPCMDHWPRGVELSLPPDGVPEVGVVTSEKKSALLQRARARDTHQAMRRQLVTSEPQ